MNIGQISDRVKPVLMKYSVRDSPHITIETNLSCNIKCRSCYNIDNSHLKSHKQVCQEVDLAMQKRNLQTITLIGGEPTLHPDIDEVIRTLFDKFEKKKIFYRLSNTVFHDTQQLVPGKCRKYARYKHFDGILALLSRTVEETIHADFKARAYGTMLAEYQGMYAQLQIKPVAYIPTSLDDRDISWLFYFFFINANTGDTFSRSSTFIGLFFRLFRKLGGRNAFALNFRPWQIPPEYHADKETFHICYHCPDATIRNGMLTPLCLADMINPMPGLEEHREISQDVYQSVYRHMEEIS